MIDNLSSWQQPAWLDSAHEWIHAELQSVVNLAQRIGYVNRALTWHMFISNLPDELKPEYASAVPSYLQEFINS